MADLNRLVEELGQLNVMDAVKLAKELEQKWGVDLSAPTTVTPPPVQGIEVVEEKNEFTVLLQAVPAEKKIAIIKEVRAITQLGLKEAKDLVEAAPKAVREGVGKADAEKFKKQLEEAGATVVLQ